MSKHGRVIPTDPSNAEEDSSGGPQLKTLRTPEKANATTGSAVSHSNALLDFERLNFSRRRFRETEGEALSYWKSRLASGSLGSCDPNDTQGSGILAVTKTHDIDHVDFLLPLRRDFCALEDVLMKTIGNHTTAEAFAAVQKVNWELSLQVARNFTPLDDKITRFCLLRQVHDFCVTYRQTRHREDLNEFLTYIADLPLSVLKVVISSLNHIETVANIAEWSQRLRRRRAQDRVGEESGFESVFSTIAGCFSELQRKGYSPEQIYSSLSTQTIDMVLTAHPTEATRGSILRNLKCLVMLVLKLDRPDLTPFEVQQLRQEVVRRVET